MTAADIARLKTALAFNRAFTLSGSSTGVGIPAGGLAGYFLGKVSNADFDVSWQPVAGGGSPNLDGGQADSNYGGITMMNGGGA